MVTAVGKKIMMMSNSVFPNGSIGKSAIIEITDIVSESIFYTNGKIQGEAMTFAAGSVPTGSSGIYVGSGSTSPSETDWKLESPLLGNQLSANSVTSYSVNDANTIMYVNYDYVLSNNTQNEITIREIGRFAAVYVSSTKGNDVTNTKKVALVDRTVLETPVVIPAGEAATVRYRFVYDVS